MPDDKGTATAEGKPDAKVEGKSESDIDKMRSTYDKREAQLRKELDASREDIAGLTLQLGEVQARAKSAEKPTPPASCSVKSNGRSSVKARSA